MGEEEELYRQEYADGRVVYHLPVPMEGLDIGGHRLGRWHEDFLEPIMLSVHRDPRVGTFVSPLDSATCQVCDVRLQFEVDGEDRARVTSAPCEYAEGLTTVVEVDFPSGQILFKDDLRPHFDASMEKISYNSAVGQDVYSRRMAAEGVAYGPVSNTSPEIYRDRAGRILLAAAAHDPETEEPLPPEGWELIGRVCTNLWAYSAVDYQRYLERGGPPVPAAHPSSYQPQVVTVEPGRYRLTHHTHEAGFLWPEDTDQLVIFGELERVG